MIDVVSGRPMWSRAVLRVSPGGDGWSGFTADSRVLGVTTAQGGGGVLLDVEIGETLTEAPCLWRLNGRSSLLEDNGLVHCTAAPPGEPPAVHDEGSESYPFEYVVSPQSSKIVPVPGPSGSGGVPSYQGGRPVLGPIAIAPGGRAAVWSSWLQAHVAYYDERGLVWERDAPYGLARSLEPFGAVHFTGDGTRIVFQSENWSGPSFEVLVVDAATGKDVEHLTGRICYEPRRRDATVVCSGQDNRERMVFSAPTSDPPHTAPPQGYCDGSGDFIRGGAYFYDTTESVADRASVLRIVRVPDAKG
jgi:hypothetical protein